MNDVESIKQALIEAGDRGLSLGEIMESFPTCSKTSASTCLKNWMDSGHIARSGVRRNYRYSHTGKDFSKPSRKGLLCQPTDSYEKIHEAISGLYGAWFSSGELVKKLRIEQSVVCNCLTKLFRDKVLERRGESRAFEYRQIASMPSFRFPKGEIPDLFFRVLQEAKRPLSVDSASLMVEKQRSLAGKNGHPRWRYYDAVRVTAERWSRSGALIVSHDPDGVAHYKLRDDITERPLSLAR